VLENIQGNFEKTMPQRTFPLHRTPMAHFDTMTKMFTSTSLDLFFCVVISDLPVNVKIVLCFVLM